MIDVLEGMLWAYLIIRGEASHPTYIFMITALLPTVFGGPTSTPVRLLANSRSHDSLCTIYFNYARLKKKTLKKTDRSSE